MKLWDIFTLVLIIWFLTALIAWPLLDIIWVKSGKIPPSSGCSLADIKRIRERGFLFHYSAFKRYKEYKGKKKQSIWVLIDEYKRDMSMR
ncbi:hypothetical protein [Alkalimarinus coralli]|uniref:hypothetical protein n=1 Tax=Alkalimarinus coralli TaxID=2935863 RepID=UPI00202B92ED|nr:hypothetical protein [Alkalimarinus coralli]